LKEGGSAITRKEVLPCGGRTQLVRGLKITFHHWKAIIDYEV